ncbi:MAG: 4Fe-4S binding protein [Erysipelotrichaceae bacterium]|nr:4Fe-4S binding protein [Erysipelotrichaceae bacterium]
MNRNKKIKELAKLMNDKSLIKVPVINDIIKCFDILLDDEQLDYLLKLGNKKYSYNGLRELYDKEDFDDFIYQLLHYGMIWCIDNQYELSPILPGWIEICLSGPMDDKKRQVMETFKGFEEFLKMVNLPGIRQYLNHHAIKNLETHPAHMSTYISQNNNIKIRINKKIEAQQEVIQDGDVYTLLKKHPDDIAVMNCMCRTIKQSDHHECHYHMPMRVCMVVGSFARQIIKYDVGDKITLDEAIKIVDECAKLGAIHTIYHYGMNSEQEEICICNCCKDCCFIYGGYQDGTVSNINVKAYYMSTIKHIDQCVKCQQCIKHCPTDALSLKNNVITLESERCIGCGQCSKKCRRDVFEIVYNERKVFVKTR